MSKKKTDPVIVTRLEIENVKRISAFSLDTDGHLIVIGGRNAAGKTSVIDSIAMALGGERLCPAEPIRRGQDRAEVTVDLSNGMKVTRTFTQKASYLKLELDDMQVKSPQGILNKLVGELAFDPLAFATAKPPERTGILEELSGIDADEYYGARLEEYDDRKALNRDAKRMKAVLKESETFPDAPEECVEVAVLMAELENRRAHNMKQLGLGRTVEQFKLAGDSADSLVFSLRQEMRKLESRVEAVVGEIRVATEEAEASRLSLGDVIAELEAFEEQDEDEIWTQINGAQEVNRQVAANKSHAEVAANLKETEEMIAERTKAIEKLDTGLAIQMDEAGLPIEGLAFDTEGGVTYNGILFDQASSAEKLRVSVAMGLALNPKLRVMLIRDGSLMDDESMKLIAKVAADNDAQLWVERVSEDGHGCSVMIEDGHIQGEEVEVVEQEEEEPGEADAGRGKEAVGSVGELP